MIRQILLSLLVLFSLAAEEAHRDTVLAPSGAPWPTRMRPVQLKERPVVIKEPSPYPAKQEEGTWWIPTLVGTGLVGGGSAAVANILGNESTEPEALGSGSSLTFTIADSDATDGTIAAITLPSGATDASFSVPGSGSTSQTYTNALAGTYTITLTTQSSPLLSYTLTVEVDGNSVASQGFTGSPATSSFTFTP